MRETWGDKNSGVGQIELHGADVFGLDFETFGPDGCDVTPIDGEVAGEVCCDCATCSRGR